MTAVAGVFVLGVAVGAVGLVDDDMYVVGAVIVFIAAVGAVVRFAEFVHRRVSAAGEVTGV